MRFSNIPPISVEDYARKIARKIGDVTPGDYFIQTSREDIGIGDISHIEVALVYQRRRLWLPKCLVRVSNTILNKGGPGNVDIKFYDGVDSKKLEVMVENMRTMYLG